MVRTWFLLLTTAWWCQTAKANTFQKVGEGACLGEDGYFPSSNFQIFYQDSLEECKRRCQRSKCTSFSWHPRGGGQNHEGESTCSQYAGKAMKVMRTTTAGPRSICYNRGISCSATNCPYICEQYGGCGGQGQGCSSCSKDKSFCEQGNCQRSCGDPVTGTEVQMTTLRTGQGKCPGSGKCWKMAGRAQGICTPCPNFCRACSGLPGGCTMCIDGYMLTDGECSPCPLNCKACIAGDHCTTCGSGYNMCNSTCQSSPCEAVSGTGSGTSTSAPLQIQHTPNAPKAEEDSLPIGVLAAVGGGVLVLGIGIGIFCMMRRAQKPTPAVLGQQGLGKHEAEQGVVVAGVVVAVAQPTIVNNLHMTNQQPENNPNLVTNQQTEDNPNLATNQQTEDNPNLVTNDNDVF